MTTSIQPQQRRGIYAGRTQVLAALAAQPGRLIYIYNEPGPAVIWKRHENPNDPTNELEAELYASVYLVRKLRHEGLLERMGGASVGGCWISRSYALSRQARQGREGRDDDN